LKPALRTVTFYPFTSEISVEADVTEVKALAMIHSAWQHAESFTGRTYYDIALGKCVVTVSSPIPFQWSCDRFPTNLMVDGLVQGWWAAHSEPHIPELSLVDLEAITTYRLTQIGTVSRETPSASVKQAVPPIRMQSSFSAFRRFFKNCTSENQGRSCHRVVTDYYLTTR